MVGTRGRLIRVLGSSCETAAGFLGSPLTPDRSVGDNPGNSTGSRNFARLSSNGTCAYGECPDNCTRPSHTYR